MLSGNQKYWGFRRGVLIDPGGIGIPCIDYISVELVKRRYGMVTFDRMTEYYP